MDNKEFDLQECKNQIETLENNMVFLHKENREMKTLLNSISASSSDMIWAKDLEGKYVYVNSKILSGLLMLKNRNEALGRTDKEIAELHRTKVGEQNHTVGAVCIDSDNTVLKNEKPMKFVEQFIVDGEVMILEVHKNVMRDPLGEVIGTVGIGRDVTYEFSKLQALSTETDMPRRYRECIKDIIYRNFLRAKE